MFSIPKINEIGPIALRGTGALALSAAILALGLKGCETFETHQKIWTFDRKSDEEYERRALKAAISEWEWATGKKVNNIFLIPPVDQYKRIRIPADDPFHKRIVNERGKLWLAERGISSVLPKIEGETYDEKTEKYLGLHGTISKNQVTLGSVSKDSTNLGLGDLKYLQELESAFDADKALRDRINELIEEDTSGKKYGPILHTYKLKPGHPISKRLSDNLLKSNPEEPEKIKERLLKLLDNYVAVKSDTCRPRETDQPRSIVTMLHDSNSNYSTTHSH